MKTIKISLIIATITVSLFALTAKGDSIVTYNGTNYDVSAVTGAFTTPSIASGVESTPWWGNGTLVHNLSALDMAPLFANSLETFEGTPSVVVSEGGVWDINADTEESNYAVGTASPVSAVPEPSMFWLFGIGALGLGGYAWRKKKRTA